MSANNTLHIAVLGGDGIGPEVMAPALEVLRRIEATSDLKFRFTEAPAGANHYRETGKSMPDSTIRLCEEADAILLGACGLPSVRYPDNTEIAPQIELRFHFDLYAGVRPARLIPGVPSPIVGADAARHRPRPDPRIHRGPVRLDGQGRRHRKATRGRQWSSRATPRSACSNSPSASPSGARRAAGPARSPASTRRMCSGPSRSSARSLTRSPGVTRRQGRPRLCRCLFGVSW